MNTCAAPALSCPTTLPGMRLPLLIPLVQESNYPLFSFITSYSILSKPFFCWALYHFIHPSVMFNTPISRSWRHVTSVYFLSNFCLIFPWSLLGTVCSGNGACKYFGPSGSTRFNCTILDVTCTASCACRATHGGRDCHLSTAALTGRDLIRWSFWIELSVQFRL